MDPNFLFLLASQSNQHLQNIETAKLQVQKEHQQQLLMEERESLLKYARTESESLLHESSIQPQRVLVRCQILLNQLHYANVIPDSYEDLTEKENVVLLWRKLMGIRDKCRLVLRAEELDQCTQCLEAIWMQSFIQAIGQRLGPYNQFQEVRTKLELEKNHLKRLEKIWYISLSVVIILIFALLFSSGSLKNDATCTGSFLLLAIFSLLCIQTVFHSKYIKIERTYRKYQHAPEDEAFWSKVRERFGGIPTEEVLNQTWMEQQAVIKTIFGEPMQPSRED